MKNLTTILICRNVIVIFLLAICLSKSYGQTTFTNKVEDAVFVKSDIVNFWKAFDLIEKEKNPFTEYLETGSIGLKDFIPYRIESPKNLLKTVKSRMQDYKSVRAKSDSLQFLEDTIRQYYKIFKEINPEAVFPPVYFVIGAFNAGGGVTDNGLIIGVEVAKDDFPNIVYFVIHELVHFNQKYSVRPIGKATLLEKSIVEGSADFFSSLTMKRDYKVEYAETHLDELCKEFVGIMNETKYYGWLYGSKGKKEGRPNDLGYWMGYKITEAYYLNSADKNKAIYDILNIKDFEAFMKNSGFIDRWLK